MLRALAPLLLLAGGCHFGVGPVDTDGALGELGVPDDAGDGGGDAAIPDLASSDHAVVYDLLDVPDGAILPHAIGWPCALASDCTAGLCVDGFCCDSLCDPLLPQNLCKACNVPGFEGRCTLALDGTDPRGQCDQSAASTCGQDGVCDGRGACRLWAAGTACTTQSCTSNNVTYPAGCDGLGHCGNLPQAVSCAPFKCADATSCEISCSKNGDCAGGVQCNNGSCGGRALGQPCAAGGDCASTFCAEGVCCATACGGTCASCAIPGSIGTCVPVPAGGDPIGTCTAQTRASCGLDGKCDGAGGCRKWVNGTPCAGPTCADSSTALSSRTCDGAGTCSPGVQTDCDHFACDPTTALCFRAPCASSAQCSGGSSCRPDGTCG
ncbi:MAG TPA: hypothetical protein VFF06_34495 [Polyangia bacterium]|nr:hypothetical protein [Polyangia bacterium]